MTGFGVGRAPIGTGAVIVEIRSVNHRFLEVRVRASRELADATMVLEQLARERFDRGRLELVARAEGTVLPQTVLDAPRAEAVVRALRELRDRVAPGEPVPLGVLSAVPELFVCDCAEGRDALLRALRDAFGRAVESMDGMREAEGEALARDLGARVGALREQLARVGARRGEVVDAYRRKLRDRVARLLAGLDAPLEPARLEQEVAIAADRCDVEEELTRLGSHLEQFERLATSEQPVGRRLDFLLQEMAREVNTIGAKSQDAALAHAVVDIKAEIERMREQVQNVE
jgi:uncharacterized protein (TIGR00255 family)